MNHMLAALYYPFSRSIRPGSTKQLLLVFNSVHYLDPVDDDDWRAKLLSDLEDSHDPRFRTYRDVHAATPSLVQEGAVVREDPKSIGAPSLGEIAVIEMGQSPSSEFYNSQGLGLPLIQGNTDIANRRTSTCALVAESAP